MTDHPARTCGNGHVVANPNAAFCGQCGLPLISEPAPPANDAGSVTSPIDAGGEDTRWRGRYLVLASLGLVVAIAAASLWWWTQSGTKSVPLALPAAGADEVAAAIQSREHLECAWESQPEVGSSTYSFFCAPTRPIGSSSVENRTLESGCAPGLYGLVYPDQVSETANLSRAAGFRLSRTCPGGAHPYLTTWFKSNVVIWSTSPDWDAVASQVLGPGTQQIAPDTAYAASQSPTSTAAAPPPSAAHPSEQPLPSASTTPEVAFQPAAARAFVNDWLNLVRKGRRTQAIAAVSEVSKPNVVYSNVHDPIVTQGTPTVDYFECHNSVCQAHVGYTQPFDGAPMLLVALGPRGYRIIGETPGSGAYYADYSGPGTYWACTRRPTADPDGTWVTLPPKTLVRVGHDQQGGPYVIPDAVPSFWNRIVQVWYVRSTNLTRVPKTITAEAGAAAWCGQRA